MVFVGFKARVDHAVNMRVLFKEVSKVVCTLGGLDDSEFQSFDSSEGKVAIEGARIDTQTHGRIVSFLHVIVVFEDESSHNDVRVTSNIFSDAVVGNISSQEQGRTDIRRGKSVITNNFDVGICLSYFLYHHFKVNQFEGRIGRTFNPQHLGFLFDGVNHVFNISDIDKFSSHAVVVSEEPSHVSVGSSIDVITDDDVITHFQGMEERAGGSTST